MNLWGATSAHSSITALCGSMVVILVGCGSSSADSSTNIGSGGGSNASGGGGSSAGGALPGGGAGGANDGSGGHGSAGLPNVCPGAAPPGAPLCRTSADCPNSGAYICAPDPFSGCGIGPPRPGCYRDADCTTGQVCVLVMPTSCRGEVNHCAPPCTSTSCSNDEICAMSGHCDPKPCTAGYACPAATVCAASKPMADAHGCAPASCSGDGYACPAGFRCAASATADAHGCSDISCTDGFVCPPNYDCHASSTSLHHCDLRTCSKDADCECGACIQSVCRPRLNVCSMLPS